MFSLKFWLICTFIKLFTIFGRFRTPKSREQRNQSQNPSNRPHATTGTATKLKTAPLKRPFYSLPHPTFLFSPSVPRFPQKIITFPQRTSFTGRQRAALSRVELPKGADRWAGGGAARPIAARRGVRRGIPTRRPRE